MKQKPKNGNEIFLQGLKDIKHKMDTDPAFLEQFRQNVAHEVTLDENDFDAGLWRPSLGHHIAAACGSADIDTCYLELFFSSYERHGQGD